MVAEDGQQTLSPRQRVVDYSRRRRQQWQSVPFVEGRIAVLGGTLGLPIHVCHFPPGTSKWNKIEHRLFSFITSNWRGKPLISHQVIVQLIGATTTKNGLKVRCQLDPMTYPAGIKVSDDELAAVNITRHEFHGEWNYTISPKARALQR